MNAKRQLAIGTSSCAVLWLVMPFTEVRADVLYVSQFYHGSVVRVNTADGTFTTFASGLSNPEGLAMDHSGNLFVAMQTQGVIDRISPSGTVTPFVSNLAHYYLSGLAFDSAGNL